MPMNRITSGSPRRNATPWVALVLVAIAYILTLEPTIGTDERSALASQFQFDQQVLEVESLGPRTLIEARNVHPSLKRIQSWVSATGAAITLADLDRDGLYNDMLLVDPRLNTLLVLPVPHTGDRYAPFPLDPTTLSFNPQTMSPTGSLVGDFDEDGLNDILVHYWGRTPVIFFRRPSEETSGAHSPAATDYVARELIPAESSQPERWFTHAATRADIDGDGHLDLLFGNFHEDGADVLDSEGTGIAKVMHAGKSNARNGGGAKLFLWVASENRPAPDQIFDNHSAAIEAHCGRGWVLAMGAADLDPQSEQWQGLPEIYIANDFGPDRLLHNRSSPGHPDFALCEGERSFTTPKSFVLGRDSYKGMGLDFGDVNGDGLLDMYVSNISDDFALHEGHFVFVSTGEQHRLLDQVAPYRQESPSLGLNRGGWGWDCRFADFNNDGTFEAIQATGFVKGTINRWPELHALGTTNDRLISNPEFWPRFIPPTADLSGHDPNPFYVRSSAGRFVDIATELELDAPWNTRGLAVADVDGDGWQDFVAANQWEPSVYFHNESSRSKSSLRNSFVGLHLILPPPSSALREVPTPTPGHPALEHEGRPAIGATATLTLRDGRKLTAQVDGGSGHSGRGAPVIHFGLGPQPPESVEITLNWRDRQGDMQREVVHVAPGHWHTVLLGKRAE